jgi:hypothetical protein
MPLDLSLENSIALVGLTPKKGKNKSFKMFEDFN